MSDGTRSGETIVVGGGLTGLVVALEASRRGGTVTLVERDTRLGGQIYTLREDGLAVEIGAEGFVARSTRLPAVARDVGAEDALIDQVTTLTFLLEATGLRALPPGEAAERLGFQVPKEELGRGIRSFRRGMGELVDAIGAELERRRDRVTIRRGAGVASIAGEADALEVVLDDGARVAGRRVVLTLPAADAARVVGEIAPDAAAALATGRSLSNASVTLRYARAQIAHPLEGSGFIVPEDAQAHGFRACSFVTTKFDRSVPSDVVLLRVFFRPTPDDLRRDAAAWIELAASSVKDALGITGAPLAGWPAVWPNALQVFDPAFRAAVARAETSLTPLGVWLAGSHFHGAGIDAAVGSALAAAELATR